MNKGPGDPRKRILLVIGGFTILTLLLGIGIFAVWRGRLAHRVELRLQRLKGAGLPVSGAELDRWYGLAPDAENPAMSVSRAFDLMGNYPESRWNEINRFKFPSRSQVLTKEETQLLASYVALTEAALEKIEVAVSATNSRYSIDLSLGVYTPMPHLLKIKALVRAAQFQVLLRPGTHDTDAIRKMLFLARTLENEPLLTSQLVRMASLDTAVQTLERSLNTSSPKSDELSILSMDFASAERTNLVARAFIGERAMDIPYFRMSSAEALRISRSEEGENAPPEHMLPGKPPIILRVTGLFERDLDFFLGVMETNVTLAELPPPRSLASGPSFEEASAAAARHHYLLSSMLLPGLTRAVRREAECLARLRCARTALAVEQFRQSRGHLPEKLTLVTPGPSQGLSLDPFDGQALRYRLIPRGYVIYSVDRDGHDDGGRERPMRTRAGDKTTYDITFTVER